MPATDIKFPEGELKEGSKGDFFNDENIVITYEVVKYDPEDSEFKFLIELDIEHRDGSEFKFLGYVEDADDLKEYQRSFQTGQGSLTKRMMIEGFELSYGVFTREEEGDGSETLVTLNDIVEDPDGLIISGSIAYESQDSIISELEINPSAKITLEQLVETFIEVDSYESLLERLGLKES